jgi:glycosyltransferase involved in cell wall biosynthesis
VLKLAPTSFFADYGCHVRILEEARALKRLGSDVRVCTYPAGRNLDEVETVRSWGLPRGGEIRVGSSRHKLYLDALLTGLSVRSTIAYRPDIIHGHLHEGALIGIGLSRAFRLPLVFDFQGSLTAEMIDHGFLAKSSRVYRPLRWLERSINRVANVVITSSLAAADLLVSEFDCDPRKVIPVPDGVDTDVFRPIWDYGDVERYRIRSALGIPPGRRVVVYLGLLAEYQGSGVLLRAARRVLERRPDVHFLLMGYPGEERYRGLAEQLGIAGSVTFTGRVPYERSPRYLAAGDVAVGPKLSSTEANGKLLNYMALGLPTVAFNTVVNRDILGDAGVYARMADVDELASALLRLLASDSECVDRGRSLRRRAEERFSWLAAGRQIVEIYDQLSRL